MALLAFHPASLIADLRFPWRLMRSAPGFTARALPTLVLGIGATALVPLRIISSLLYGVTASDSIAFTSAVLMLLAVAFVATLISALRASRVDPLVALRQD